MTCNCKVQSGRFRNRIDYRVMEARDQNEVSVGLRWRVPRMRRNHDDGKMGRR